MRNRARESADGQRTPVIQCITGAFGRVLHYGHRGSEGIKGCWRSSRRKRGALTVDAHASLAVTSGRRFSCETMIGSIETRIVRSTAQTKQQAARDHSRIGL